MEASSNEQIEAAVGATPEAYHWRKLPLKSLIAFIIMAAGFYLGLIVYADSSKLIAALEALPWQSLLFILGLAFASYSLRFLRWHWFLTRLGQKPAKLVNLLVYWGGFTLSMTPAKAGESLRALMLAPFGVKLSASLACFISERSLDLLLVAALASLALGVFPQYQIYSTALITVIGAVFIVVIALKPSFILHRFERKLGGLGQRFGLLSQGLEAFIGFWQRLLALKVLLPAAALALLSWSAQGLILDLIVTSQGYRFPLAVMIGVYCLSVLAGAFSFIPGGVGATEGVMAGLLVVLGLELEAAIICALICRLLTLWLAMLVGIVSLLGFEWYLKRHPLAS